MKINPVGDVSFQWSTPNPYPVNVELGRVTEAGIEPVVVLIGDLQANPDEKYTVNLDLMAWGEGEHAVALRAIDPARTENAISAWSAPAPFVVRTVAPNPPIAVAVE